VLPTLLTKVQNRMMQVLSDGLPHTREELHACLADELGPTDNIRSHISGIRKFLNPKGYDILFVRKQIGFRYILIRLLHSPNDGSR
jgi:hypothetical protein